MIFMRGFKHMKKLLLYMMLWISTFISGCVAVDYPDRYYYPDEYYTWPEGRREEWREQHRHEMNQRHEEREEHEDHHYEHHE
jgi:hypothetical protein